MQIYECEMEEIAFTNPLAPGRVAGTRVSSAVVDAGTLLLVFGGKGRVEELSDGAKSAAPGVASRGLTFLKERFPQWTIAVTFDRPGNLAVQGKDDFSLSDLDFLSCALDAHSELRLEILLTAKDLQAAAQDAENVQRNLAQMKSMLAPLMALDETRGSVFAEVLERLRVVRDGRQTRLALDVPAGLVKMYFSGTPVTYLDQNGERVDSRSQAKWVELFYVRQETLKTRKTAGGDREITESERVLEYYTTDGQPAVITVGGFWRRVDSMQLVMRGEKLESYREPSRAFFGVDGKPIECSDGYAKVIEEYDTNGKRIGSHYFDARGQRCHVRPVVAEVLKESQGESLGLKPGDVLVEYQGTAIESAVQFIALHGRQAEGTANLVVDRDGRRLTFAVKTGLIGVSLKDEVVRPKPAK